MSTATRTGALFGAILALTWLFLGFWPFFFVAAAMALGSIGRRILDGKLGVANLVDAFRGTRSSS